MSPRISLRLLSGQSDERLLTLARSGHERAFEALVQRYRRPLLRFCRRTMRLSDARAEDVVQQSLLKAWIALATGTEVRDFKPWLYSIVRNTALNAMRGPAEAEVALTDAVRAHASAESDLEQRLEIQDALTHVAALPQAQREAIFLTVLDGQSHEEVASALGITNGAVRGLIYRARTTLRRAAAAITPPPLIAWAAGSAGPSAERIAEVTSGAGALGASGLLAKGAVLAVTAGALATGAVVQLGHSVTARHGTRVASANIAHAGSTDAAGLGSGMRVSGTRAAGTTANAASPARDGASFTHQTRVARHAGTRAAPVRRSVGRSREQAVEGEPSSSRASGGGGSGRDDGVPTATTAGTPIEPPVNAQPAPETPQPAPETQDHEPTQPGGTEPRDDGSCPSESKTCPDK
jgi:RNA polymerase sigma factor (sigma-70 family)